MLYLALKRFEDTLFCWTSTKNLKFAHLLQVPWFKFGCLLLENKSYDHLEFKEPNDYFEGTALSSYDLKWARGSTCCRSIHQCLSCFSLQEYWPTVGLSSMTMELAFLKVSSFRLFKACLDSNTRVWKETDLMDPFKLKWHLHLKF